MYFNARSITNKIDELELYIKDENPDIIGITETWLHEEIVDTELNAGDYTIYRHDRNNKHGGGAALLIKKSINSVLRDDLKDNFEEGIWCDIICNNTKTLVGVCYRSTTIELRDDDKLYALIDKINKEKLIVVMGDFNFEDSIDWINNTCSAKGKLFLDCITKNFLHQHVVKPTRGNNILDLVITSDIDLVKNLEVGENFGNSDHYIIRFDLAVTYVKENNRRKFNYAKGDYIKANILLQDVDWNLIITNNVEESWLCLKNLLSEIRDKCVPLSKNRRSVCKWCTRKVIKCRRAKIKAWKKYCKSRSVESFEKYKIKRNLSVKVNRNAQRDYETKLAKNIKTDSKSFFCYVNNKNKLSNKIGPLKDTAAKIIADDGEMANMLNEYFGSVFTKDLSNNDVNGTDDKFLGEKLTFITVTEQEVLKKLQCLKINKSVGPDNIHPKLLLELKLTLAKPLAKLFQLSLNTGVVPEDWRIANVTPLFKKGSRCETKNYRPVSLTSIPCKILETIIKDNINKHLLKHNLISDSQHGFSAGKSCLTNLLDFYNCVTEWLDDGYSVDIIYLDFAKAFDKVSHVKLITKLKAYGITGCVSNWIKQWLNNRKQRVTINGNFSDWSKVTSGVPQGSVLGPQLFTIFIDDIDNAVKSKLSKFADDTKLGKMVNNVTDASELQLDLDKLYDWSKQWLMEFNLDKCVCMHMGSKNINFQYNIGGTSLKTVDKEKDLGVLIDKNFKFTEHCALAVKKANQMLGIIKRKIQHKSKDVIVKLYKTLIRPHLEYCVQLWSPYLKSDIKLLEGVQRRALKMIYGFSNINYAERLNKAGLITLEKRRVRGDLIHMFKMSRNLISFNRIFLVNSRPTVSLRGNHLKIFKSRCKLNIRKNFFNQRVVNYWNKLPDSIVCSNNLNLFKNSLDRIEYFTDTV